MRSIVSPAFVIVVTVFPIGCSKPVTRKFYADEGRANARALAMKAEWFIAGTTNDPAPQMRNKDGSVSNGDNIGSKDCGDCTADLVLALATKPGGTWDYTICISKSNTQFSEFAGLKRGDKASFEYTDTPTQAECGSGAYLKILRPASSSGHIPSDVAGQFLSAAGQHAEDKIVRDEALTAHDTSELSPTELRLLRNAVFAKHGRTFNSPDLRNYFGTRPWYRPNDGFNEAQLSETDRANIAVLQARENQQTVTATGEHSGLDAAPVRGNSLDVQEHQPTEAHARSVFENLTRSIPIWGGRPLTLTVLSFRKTDGQARMESGVKQYRVFFEAEVQCPRNDYVNMLDVPINIGIHGSHRQGRERIKGFVVFERTERGWKGQDGTVY